MKKYGITIDRFVVVIQVVWCCFFILGFRLSGECFFFESARSDNTKHARKDIFSLVDNHVTESL